MTNASLPCRLRHVTQSACCTLSRQPFYWLDLNTPKRNAFDQFWKFKFRIEYFPRNSRFLSFNGPINYLYLFKNHQQTFSWPGERPSSRLKVTKIWFDPNINYLLESFFANFCCRESISSLQFDLLWCQEKFRKTMELKNVWFVL